MAKPMARAPSIGVAVVGTGWMARAHTHALRALADLDLTTPAVRLRMIVSRERARAEQSARRLGYETASDDWRAAIDDPDVDLVLNVSANTLHAEPCMAALAAGKHVVCEKPIAVDVATAAAMSDLASTHPE